MAGVDLGLAELHLHYARADNVAFTKARCTSGSLVTVDEDTDADMEYAQCCPAGEAAIVTCYMSSG